MQQNNLLELSSTFASILEENIAWWSLIFLNNFPNFDGKDSLKGNYETCDKNWIKRLKIASAENIEVRRKIPKKVKNMAPDNGDVLEYVNLEIP